MTSKPGALDAPTQRTALEAALATARATVAALEAALVALDLGHAVDELVTLRDGALGLSGETLIRWAREGRLRAFEVERGRLVAWTGDIREAIEARPVTTRSPAPANDSTEPDPFAADIRGGKLRAVR